MKIHTSMKKHTNNHGNEQCSPIQMDLDQFHKAIGTIVGKWKVEILWVLFDGPLRFGEIRRALPKITQHMLTAQLRAMETDKLINRREFAEIPLRVEYSLTEHAIAFKPAFFALTEWSHTLGVKK